MKPDASGPAFCLDAAMGKIPASLVVLAGLVMAGSAAAYSGHWLVVEAVDTQTCYRMTEFPEGKNWRQLGEFNTFRQAGMWIWEHRDGLCQDSPVFH